MKSHVFLQKMLVFLTFCGCLSYFSSELRAQYTFPALPSQPITATTVWQDLSLDVSGVPAGNYSGYTVTVAWTAGTGGPWSSEARIRFNSGSLLGESQPTTGGANSGAATTLTWSGEFSSIYVAGAPLSLGIRQTFTGSTGIWNNMNVSITLAPACPAPNQLSATGINLTSANLTWNSLGSTFDVEHGLTGFSPTGIPTHSGVGNPFNITGLAQGTGYQYYVRQDCGVDGTSTWSGPFAFTTLNVGSACEAPIVVGSLPYTTTDNTSNYGSNYLGSPGAVNCSTTSPYLNGDDVVYSFTADFDGVVNLSMMPTATWSGVFVYESCADIGVACAIGQANSAATERNFDFPVVNGNTYFIVISTFAAPQSTGYTLTLTQVLCPNPTALTLQGLTTTSAGVSWTPGANETSWNVEWGAPGFIPGTGAEIGSQAVNMSSIEITGLLPSTNYDVFVQADCGSGTTSTWVGPFSIFTGYCLVSTSFTSDYTSAFSTTGAIANVNYTASIQPPGSYADETAQVFQAIAGSSFDFSHTFVGGGNGIRMWADWNNNLVFDDSEQLFQLADANLTKTGTINIPANIPPGNYRFRLRSQWGSTAIPPACGNVSWGSTVDFTIQIVEIPVSPELSQAADQPTCTGGTFLTAAGAPEQDVEWFWQTTADGVSTANPYNGPLAVFANGTYFIRAFKSIFNYWAPASSITITNFPTETLTDFPIAAQNPACVPGTEVAMPQAPADVLYFWQTVENGSSQALPATTPLTVSQTSTVLVAAFNTVTQCWSSTNALLVTVETDVPPAPTANPTFFNFCAGVSAAEISAVAAPMPGGSCVITATASGIDNTGVTATVNDFSCTGGAPMLSATLDATIGGFCPTWYVYSIVVNGNVVATNQCNQTGFDLTPFLPLTSVSIVSADTDIFGDFVTMNLTVNVEYAVGDFDMAWYSAQTGGELLGTGTTLQTVGTSVMPTAALGTYTFWATSVNGACESSTRVPVVVNINAVDAVLTAVNNTCNGGNAGSFVVETVNCGTAPFTFAIDGGAFGPIPSNLTAGTYSIVMQDATNGVSGPLIITITEPAPVSNLTANAISATEIELAWSTTGDEIQWNIEYGEFGFAPGSGTVVNVATNPAIIDGLTPGTNYSFFVQSACGPNGVWVGPVSEATDFGCGGAFFDNGGLTGNYLPNSNVVDVICPFDAGDYVEVVFTEFNTEASFDGIYVYDGNSINAPMIASANPAGFGPMTMPGAWWGNTIPGPFESSSAGGCLTFNFVSDGSVQLSGFVAEINCYPCFPTPGIDGEVNVCRLDGTLDLNSVVTLNSDRGAWHFPGNPSVLNGSILNVGFLPTGTVQAYYIVNTPCTSDTTVATIHIFPASSAGQSASFSNCNNGFINLFDGLSGLVDLTGTWYSPANQPLSSALVNVNGFLVGSYNYYYVASNGVCPADTSFAQVNLFDCASVDEFTLAGFELYPNPTENIIFISYKGEALSARVFVNDAKGSVIYSENKTFESNSTLEIDLSSQQSGAYVVTILSEGKRATMHLIKQ